MNRDIRDIDDVNEWYSFESEVYQLKFALKKDFVENYEEKCENWLL